MNREQAIALLRRHCPSFPRDPAHGPLARIVDAVMEASSRSITQRAPVYQPGTTLAQLVRDGVSRGLPSEQIIAEAAASGHIIDDELVSIVERDFERCLLGFHRQLVFLSTSAHR